MERRGFNDNWTVMFKGLTFENVMLPFDAMLHSPREAKNDNGSNTGYFAGGKYTYSKVFVPDEGLVHKNVFLHFEGVYQNATIYINGEKVFFHPYGYTPFSVDITDNIVEGKEIEVRVNVDNIGRNSRWYSGGGILRDVTLLFADKKAYIQENGIKFNTDRNYDIRYEIDHIGGEVTLECFDEGRLLCSSKGSVGTLKVEHPALWEENNPHLYDIHVRLTFDGSLREEHHIRYGIRYIELKENGLLINGKIVKLRGACVHHDNGPLGGVSIWEVELRRIKILKESGFNAIRVAHQPASENMLKACDELGIYVLDELFDMFYIHKNSNDYASYFKEWYLRDAEAMVNHDYNHPSVIMYSLGNEISETAFDEGVGYVRELKDFIHQLDQGRPVTAGINFFLNYFASKGKGIYSNESKGRIDEKKNVRKIMDSKVGSAFVNVVMNNLGRIKNIISKSKRADRATEKVLDTLDIAGYNYGTSRYLKDKKLHPKRVILGTETFPIDLAKNWNLVLKNDHLIGDFMWTGWDYLGEAGIGVIAYNYSSASAEKDYPFLLAGSGVIDILGNPRPEVYWNKLIWGLEKGPYLAVEPINHSVEKRSHSAWRNSDAVHSYSFEGCENRKTVCHVYSNGSTVELYLNGKLKGRKKIIDFKATFSFLYEPGILMAKAYDKQGRILGEDVLVSAKKECRIHIEKEIFGDYLFFDFTVVDEDGNLNVSNEAMLEVNVTGGNLVSFSSADPCEREPYGSNRSKTYRGRALAIIKRAGNGEVKISVKEVKNNDKKAGTQAA